MKTQVCLAALAICMIWTGCKKEPETPETPHPYPKKSAPAKADRVYCMDGRLVFTNVETFDKVVETLMPYDDEQLFEFEARYPGYESYRTSMGTDAFEDERLSFTQDDVLGTVLNRQGTIQIGDSAYCVFLKDGQALTHMAIKISPETINALQKHELGTDVVDITGQNIYEEKAAVKCGDCLGGYPHHMGNKNTTKYITAGQKFYFKAKVAYEAYGFYNSLYAKITHHKWSGTLTPVNFMNITGCGRNKTRSGKSCIYPSSYPYMPSFSHDKMRYNFTSGSRCARQYYVNVAMGAQRYNESGVQVEQLMPTYPVERGLTSCN